LPDPEKIGALLDNGASPWAVDRCGQSALNGLLHVRKSSGLLSMHAWSLAAKGKPRPQGFRYPFEYLMDAMRRSNVNVADYVRLLASAGIPAELDLARRFWDDVFPDEEFLRRSGARWDIAAALIKASPSLAAQPLPGGRSPFSGAFYGADPAFVVTTALQWPGSDVNMWKNSPDPRERHAALTNLVAILGMFGGSFFDAGLDIYGADDKGFTLAHHLMNAPNVLHGAVSPDESSLAFQALLFLIGKGVDFDACGPGWSPLDRLNKTRWSDMGALATVIDAIRNQKHAASLHDEVSVGRRHLASRL
jgi:hypothetical protein